MMKHFAKYTSFVLASIAFVMVIGTASVSWLHNPEVPEELLK